LKETGILFAYDHFVEGESPEPPFVCYLMPQSDNFDADGMVYHKITGANIELYSDIKDPLVEQRLEDALDKRRIFYNKSETWIESENCMRSFTNLTWRWFTMPKKNKVKFNICNVHYALLTLGADGAVSFGTPVAMPGSVSLSLDPNGEPSNFYADGYAYYTVICHRPGGGGNRPADVRKLCQRRAARKHGAAA